MQTGEFDIKKDATWAISNASSIGTHDQSSMYLMNIYDQHKHISKMGCLVMNKGVNLQDVM